VALVWQMQKGKAGAQVQCWDIIMTMIAPKNYIAGDVGVRPIKPDMAWISTQLFRWGFGTGWGAWAQGRRYQYGHAHVKNVPGKQPHAEPEKRPCLLLARVRKHQPQYACRNACRSACYPVHHPAATLKELGKTHATGSYILPHLFFIAAPLRYEKSLRITRKLSYTIPLQSWP